MQGLTVRVDKLGRILLPAGVRKAAGLEPDTRLIVRVHAGRIELMTLAGAVRMAQSIVRRHVKPGARLADELLAARRADVRRQSPEAAQRERRRRPRARA